VQAFPASGGKWQISKDGGRFPKWRRDGKELFYLGADRQIVAVDVKTGAAIQPGIPKPLFEIRSYGQVQYAVTHDGQRFLVPTAVGEAESKPATIVINWTAGIKR